MARSDNSVQSQRWTCTTKTGNTFDITTRIGVGPQAAVEGAGYFWSEVEHIVASGITLQEDMRAWRQAPGYLSGSNGSVVL